MDVELSIGIFSQNELHREGLGRILADRGLRVICSSGCLDDFPNGGKVADLILVVTDLARPDFGSCVWLKKNMPGVRILLMADAAMPEDVADAVRSGAVDGYVVKKIACNALAAAVRLVALGEKIFPPEMVAASYGRAKGFSDHRRPDAAGNLSTRELEILSCLVLGDANKVISQRLGISDASVKMCIKAILRKLHVANRTQAAMWAVSRGLAVARSPRSSDQDAPWEGIARARMADRPSAAMA